MAGPSIDPDRKAPNAHIDLQLAASRDEFGNQPREWIMSERWRRARAYPEYANQGVYPPGSQADFPIVTVPPTDNVGIFVYNTRSRATHQVPDEWVTEDENGIVYVRGKGGHSYATEAQITAYIENQGLEPPVFPPA